MQKLFFFSFLISATVCLLGPTQAQTTALQRVELQKAELPPDQVGFLDLVTIAANGVAPPLTHPGVQLFYVLEGEVSVKVGAEPKQGLKSGMSFKIPAGAPYSFENYGAKAAKLIDFVVEKDATAGTAAP